MRRAFVVFLSIAFVGLTSLACNLFAPAPPPKQPTSTSSPVPNNTVDVRTLTELPFTPTPQVVVAIETPLPTPTTPPSGNSTAEAIAILSPGAGSQVSGPITVSGIADSVFENMLAIQVIDQNGEVIGNGVASIHADLGSRGPFDGQVTFTPPSQAEPGRIVLSDSSARDGHLTHLNSVEVTLLPNGGVAALSTNIEQPEAIQIQSATGSVSSGHQTFSITGYAAPAFEQTLTITVLDENGGVAGSGTATIQAEAGQPGQFIGSLTYTVDHEQPGSVQVYSTSARDGGITHLSSVEVTLKP